VTVGTAGAGDAASWAAVTATALLPFAFLAGLLRSHVARLDAELRARLQELRASPARLVEAGDTERRRLERDLHDGAGDAGRRPRGAHPGAVEIAAYYVVSEALANVAEYAQAPRATVAIPCAEEAVGAAP
jgi:signal transduction histidine kinase